MKNNSFLYSQHFWHKICGFSDTKQFSNFWQTPTGCPRVSFSFDTNFLEFVQTPQVRGSVSLDCPHFRGPSQVPGFHYTSDQQVINQELLWPLLGFNNLLECLLETQGEIVYLLSLAIIYCKRIQLGNTQMEEMHRAREKEVPTSSLGHHPQTP